MDAALKIWIVIGVVGLLNYLSRLSFIAVFARRRMPSLLARALKYVPAAMLTALIVPMITAEPSATHAPILGHSCREATRLRTRLPSRGSGRLAHRTRVMPTSNAQGVRAVLFLVGDDPDPLGGQLVLLRILPRPGSGPHDPLFR